MSLAALAKRQYGYGNDYDCNYYDNCTSAWWEWGRWVLFGAIVAIALLAFFIFSCVNARRRRRLGRQPFRGTAWMAPQHGPVTYYGPGGSNVQQQPMHNDANQAAPPYSASNTGYYGQQSGYEMQTPANTYQPPRGGDPVYAPPQGPPPQKV